MKLICLTSLALLVATIQVARTAAIDSYAASDKVYVCYFGSWSVYRPGAGKFDVENIDPFLCTHIIFGFAALDNITMSRIISYDPYNDLYDNWGRGAYLRFTGLKKKNPALKTLLAIGGWNEGSEKYSLMAKDPLKRSSFIRSVITFLSTYGFDGLDFDWEYPGTRGGDPAVDKANFITLLRELKTAFAPYGYLLTSAVSPGQITIDAAYDIPALASQLDQIHLMAYDYHGAWETFTGLNSPLYGNSQVDVANESTLNVEWSVNYWISKGAPASKIILGMPLYGRGFTLDDPSRNGLKAPARNPIAAGPYSRQEGSWNFNEICELVTSDWTKVRDPCFQVSYAYRGNQWIGYDDQQSLTLKAQYASAMNLGGILFWSIDQEDFLGKCNNGQSFGLVKSVKSVMNGGSNALPPKCGSPAIPTTAPVTPTAIQTTTARATTTTTTATPSTTRNVVCYFGSWSVYRPSPGKFDVEDIDPFLCTHVIFGFAALDNITMDAIISYDPYNDLYDNWGRGAYLRFTGLKKQNPALKTLLAIGGWNEGSEKYSMMAKNPLKRSNFVRSVVSFLSKYGFDGLDFDWEYPGTRGGDPAVDKANFISLIRELKSAFAPYGYLLTSAVSPGQISIDAAYDIPALASILDQIHLMAYDFHGAWETVTGLNSPLYGNSQVDVANESTLNVDWSVNYWISKGASPSKIILGVPLYGRGFTLDDPSRNGLKAPARNPIAAGPYSRQEGSWGLNEICELVTSDWTKVRDPCFQVPYAYRGNQWIGYDDQQSLNLKAQYATAMNLGGVLFWSIDQEDFLGKCSGQKFGSVKAVKSVMNSGTAVLPPKCGLPATTSTTRTVPTSTTVGATSTSTRPTTTVPTSTTSTSTTTTTTTVAPPTTSRAVSTTVPAVQSTTTASTGVTLPPTAYCKKEGFNTYPPSCFRFVQCIRNYLGAFIGYLMTCAPGTYFKEESSVGGGLCVSAPMGFSCP